MVCCMAEPTFILEIELRRQDRSDALGFMDTHEVEERDVGVAGAVAALAAVGCIPFKRNPSSAQGLPLERAGVSKGVRARPGGGPG